MEFKLTTPIDKLRAGVIEFNASELKTELTNALAKYEGITYDDGNITLAKKDRAALNNLKSQIDSVRKSAKTEWNDPFVRFESEVKELIALVDKPITAIDAQVKDYEVRQKELKRGALQEFFNSIIGENASLLKFDDIFNEKWLNVTFTEAKAVEEIRAIVEQFTKDLEVVGNEGGEFKAQLYDYFLRTRSLTATFAEKQRLIAQNEAMEQLKAREVERKATEVKTMLTAQATASTAQATPTEAPQERNTVTIRFEVEGTKEEIMALSEYLKTNNLTYRRI